MRGKTVQFMRLGMIESRNLFEVLQIGLVSMLHRFIRIEQIHQRGLDSRHLIQVTLLDAELQTDLVLHLYLDSVGRRG